jgi:hypothetical protein
MEQMENIFNTLVTSNENCEKKLIKVTGKNVNLTKELNIKNNERTRFKENMELLKKKNADDTVKFTTELNTHAKVLQQQKTNIKNLYTDLDTLNMANINFNSESSKINAENDTLRIKLYQLTEQLQTNKNTDETNTAALLNQITSLTADKLKLINKNLEELNEYKILGSQFDKLYDEIVEKNKTLEKNYSDIHTKYNETLTEYLLQYTKDTQKQQEQYNTNNTQLTQQYTQLTLNYNVSIKQLNYQEKLLQEYEKNEKNEAERDEYFDQIVNEQIKLINIIQELHEKLEQQHNLQSELTTAKYYQGIQLLQHFNIDNKIKKYLIKNALLTLSLGAKQSNIDTLTQNIANITIDKANEQAQAQVLLKQTTKELADIKTEILTLTTRHNTDILGLRKELKDTNYTHASTLDTNNDIHTKQLQNITALLDTSQKTFNMTLTLNQSKIDEQTTMIAKLEQDNYNMTIDVAFVTRLKTQAIDRAAYADVRANTAAAAAADADVRANAATTAKEVAEDRANAAIVDTKKATARADAATAEADDAKKEQNDAKARAEAAIVYANTSTTTAKKEATARADAAIADAKEATTAKEVAEDRAADAAKEAADAVTDKNVAVDAVRTTVFRANAAAAAKDVADDRANAATTEKDAAEARADAAIDDADNLRVQLATAKEYIANFLPIKINRDGEPSLLKEQELIMDISDDELINAVLIYSHPDNGNFKNVIDDILKNIQSLYILSGNVQKISAYIIYHIFGYTLTPSSPDDNEMLNNLIKIN